MEVAIGDVEGEVEPVNWSGVRVFCFTRVYGEEEA